MALKYSVHVKDFASFINTLHCTKEISVMPKKLYIIEGKPLSAFFRPVVGECLSTFTDFVQKSGRE
jgi:hypothetical protein